MLLLSALFYLFIIIGVVHLVHFALFLIGANLYDARAYRSKLKNKESTSDHKPMVSVLIPAYNEETVIERCLQSVWKNTYSNIEIIIVNDGSTDKTSRAVNRFIKSRSRPSRQRRSKVTKTKYSLKRVWHRGNTRIKRRIKLVEQSNGGKGSALNRALRGHARGELIMTLDADSLLHPQAIANVIKYFKDPAVAGVAANVRIIEKTSVLGILQRFDHMVGYRSKKFFTISNSEIIVGGVASTYHRSAIEAAGFYDTDTITEDIGLSMKVASLGNKLNRLVYAYDVAAMTEGVSDFSSLLKQRYRWKLGNVQNLFKYRKLLFSTDSKYSKTLTFYRMPMAFIGELLILLEPLSLAYVLYLSIHFLSLALFLAAYITITVYMLMVLWPDEHLTVKGKMKASLFVPFLYFFFYIMNVIQLLSVLRVLKNHKSVTRLSPSNSGWISPERAGGTASFS